MNIRVCAYTLSYRHNLMDLSQIKKTRLAQMLCASGIFNYEGVSIGYIWHSRRFFSSIQARKVELLRACFYGRYFSFLLLSI